MKQKLLKTIFTLSFLASLGTAVASSPQQKLDEHNKKIEEAKQQVINRQKIYEQNKSEKNAQSVRNWVERRDILIGMKPDLVKAVQDEQQKGPDQILGRAASAEERKAFDTYKTLFKRNPNRQQLTNLVELQKYFLEGELSNIRIIGIMGALENKAINNDLIAQYILEEYANYAEPQDVAELSGQLAQFAGKDKNGRIKHVKDIVKKRGVIKAQIVEGNPNIGYYALIERTAYEDMMDIAPPNPGMTVYLNPNQYNANDPNLVGAKYIYFNNVSKKPLPGGQRSGKHINVLGFVRAGR